MRRKWSREEIEILIDAYKNPFAGFHLILQKKLNRSRGSVDGRARKLGLTDKKRSGNRIKGLKKPWVKEYTPFREGKDHIGWKGGRYKAGGYIHVYDPGNPFIARKYVKEHRFVMEKYLGRYLRPDEIVHHINGVKDDNRIENLELATTRTHHPGHDDMLIIIKNFIIQSKHIISLKSDNELKFY